MECCSTNKSTIQQKEVFNNACISCKKISQKIQYKTILMMLKYQQIKTAKIDEYFYCTNPNCDVVYFSNQYRLVFYKEDIRIRIGIKETEEPKTVCYCFDITKKQITDELKLTGKSSITNFITEKIQNKLCACNIKNPSGKCCLGKIKELVNSNI
jgi:hypothetical protein